MNATLADFQAGARGIDLVLRLLNGDEVVRTWDDVGDFERAVLIDRCKECRSRSSRHDRRRHPGRRLPHRRGRQRWCRCATAALPYSVHRPPRRPRLSLLLITTAISRRGRPVPAVEPVAGPAVELLGGRRDVHADHTSADSYGRRWAKHKVDSANLGGSPHANRCRGFRIDTSRIEGRGVGIIRLAFRVRHRRNIAAPATGHRRRGPRGCSCRLHQPARGANSESRSRSDRPGSASKDGTRPDHWSEPAARRQGSRVPFW